MASTTIKYFAHAHLPPKLQAVSKPVGQLADLLEKQLPDGPEKSAGMRKLLEAKDCFVRVALDMPDQAAVPGAAQPLGVRIERSEGVTDMPYASLRAEMDGSVATIRLNMDAIRAGGFFKVEAACEKPVATSHQQRVLAEKMDRDQEISRLDTFIRESPIFATLPADEQARLRRQLDVMHELSTILGERIANF